MIQDGETNYLYLADTLKNKHKKFFEQFEIVLNDCSIKTELLHNTKDIWAVDYMPIQISKNKFVQFTYNPDYLKKYQDTISDVDSICRDIGIAPEQSTILVDGGNVVRSSDKVIMCDKIFSENPTINEKDLIKQLEECLEIENLLFVPLDKNDWVGHADGMVRFLDEKTVIINDYSKEKPQFQRTFLMALHNAGLDWIEIPYNPYENKSLKSAKGIYINYLQMNGVVIVPTFGIKEDDIATKKFGQLFRGQTIKTIDSNDIAKEGGVLNCITWNIMS